MAQRRFELVNTNSPLRRLVELHAGGPFLVRTARTITVLKQSTTRLRTQCNYHSVGFFSFTDESGGSSLDFAYELCDIKYAFQFQLRDQGNWGFLLPRNQIIPAAAEFFAGITELVRFVHFYEMRPEL